MQKVLDACSAVLVKLVEDNCMWTLKYLKRSAKHWLNQTQLWSKFVINEDKIIEAWMWTWEIKTHRKFRTTVRNKIEFGSKVFEFRQVTDFFKSMKIMASSWRSLVQVEIHSISVLSRDKEIKQQFIGRWQLTRDWWEQKGPHAQCILSRRQRNKGAIPWKCHMHLHVK